MQSCIMVRSFAALSALTLGAAAVNLLAAHRRVGANSFGQRVARGIFLVPKRVLCALVLLSPKSRLYLVHNN